jgi:hypothetical protein
MNLEKLVSKYIASAEHVLEALEMVKNPGNPLAERSESVVESARAYLQDAKHFRDEGKLEVSLTSVAYCEGLLDALRSLGAVRFEWPTDVASKRER